jgi:hypothetical protein
MKVSDNLSVCDCNIFYLTETQKTKNTPYCTEGNQISLFNF